MRDINEITGAIVDAAYRLHTRLGPGLMESVYEDVLERALGQRGLHVEKQKLISFEFDGMRFESAFRVDLFAERQVVAGVSTGSSIPTCLPHAPSWTMTSCRRTASHVDSPRGRCSVCSPLPLLPLRETSLLKLRA